MTVMLWRSSWAAAPTPESMRICGELYVPPEMMTSREAAAEPGVPVLEGLLRGLAR